MNTTQKSINKALESNAKEVNKEVKEVPKKEGNLPEKKFRAGAISATIWLNKGQNNSGEETEYRTITIERSYTDKEGKWQSSNSLRTSDLPKATIVLQKAYEHLVLNEQDNFKRD